MKLRLKTIAQVLAAMVCFLCHPATIGAQDKPADDSALSAAICPIVYPVDQIPVERGYHYLFYGNGFFINEQGYLLTAAHVLSQLHGGQPYVLLRQHAGPPQFVRAILVAVDRDHDVAVLRATPNPFGGTFEVGFLPLAYDWLTRGHGVLAGARHPSKPLDAYTLDASVDDRSTSEIFDFQFSQLDKGRSDTELFLFNHQVRRGQSGGPVISSESREVVGFVEGQWLRSTLVPLTEAADQSTPGVGAAVPIHYAISLLQQKSITWHKSSGAPQATTDAEGAERGFSPPAPLSLVEAAYPSQALFGGEVVLDALVDSQGRIAEVKLVRGASPFLEKAFSTVRTWSFFPARLDGQPVAARVGITFQFSQSLESSRAAMEHEYDEPLATSAERGALPVATSEPHFPAPSAADGRAILYGIVGQDGQLISARSLGDTEPFTSAAIAALHQWRFVPGKREGAAVDSATIAVMVFRHTGSAESTSPAK
jgi:TonB family protein